MVVTESRTDDVLDRSLRNDENNSSISSKIDNTISKSDTREQDEDDDSTICTEAEESMQLSLPESFDDTLTLNGVPILPGYTKKSPGEVQLLQAQLLEARQKVKHLTREKEIEMHDISNIVSVDDVQLQQIQHLPSNERTLAQHAALTIHMAIESERRELQVVRERASNAMELAEQQKEKASNAQILCEQRISNLQETLDAAKDRQGELEIKISDQQSTILELKEKGRMYDELALEKKSLTDEVTRLRMMLDQKQTHMDLLQKQEYVSQSKVEELNRVIQTLQMDKTFLEKEKSILEDRADRAELNSKKSDEALREAVLKSDNLTLQLAEANTTAKCSYEEQSARNTKKMREESEMEMKTYRGQVEAAYEREIQLLKDSKAELTSQFEKVNGELDRIRSNLDRVTAEKSSTIVELERSLSDCRSDLKIKCVESTRLQVTNETLEQDLKFANRNIQMLTDQVEVHKTEFTNLEQESLFDRKRLMGEIERKDEQLEIYFQSSQSHARTSSSKSHINTRDNHDINHLHLLDKSASLNKKCGALKKQLISLQGQLKKQVTKAKHYESKLMHANKALENISNRKNDVDQSSTKSNLEEKDRHQLQQQQQVMEIQNLLAQNASLRDDLSTARQERDKLAQEFSFLLNKYHELVHSGGSHQMHAFPHSSSKNDSNCASQKHFHTTSTDRPKKVWTIHHAGKIRKYSSSSGNQNREGYQHQQVSRTTGDMSKHSTHHASVMKLR